MHFTQIEKVVAGDTVAMPIKNYDGVLLINSGVMLTQKMIGNLIGYGINGIYVTDDLGDDFVIEEAISQELKAETINNLKHLNVDNALGNAKKIVNALSTSKQCDYINIKTFDDYTYEHSVSVSVYATLVGLEACLDEKQLENLACAGLLHDIGKLSIKREILNKPGKLTDEEYTEIKKHTDYGYNMLKDNILIGATTKMGVFEHHENEDGSGYPRQIKGDKIYKFAKIIHIVDVYDAIVSKRPYKPARTPQEAIDFLKEHAGTMFDKEYLDIFLKVVPAYPKGIMVELSNGMVGVVIANRKGKMLRPIIRTIDGIIIDLAEDEAYKDVTII